MKFVFFFLGKKSYEKNLIKKGDLLLLYLNVFAVQLKTKERKKKQNNLAKIITHFNIRDVVKICINFCDVNKIECS